MRFHQNSGHEEPIGIVIADGGRVESAPRFTAFVWGPVPDEETLDVQTLLGERPAALAAV